jgi:hypothetical protein
LLKVKREDKQQMQLSQEVQNRIKELLRKDNRCVVESMADRQIKVRAYPRKIKKEEKDV